MQNLNCKESKEKSSLVAADEEDDDDGVMTVISMRLLFIFLSAADYSFYL